MELMAPRVIMPRAEAYGSSFVCLFVSQSVIMPRAELPIMPRAELPRYTVIVLSVRPSVCLSFTSISRRSLKTKR